MDLLFKRQQTPGKFRQVVFKLWAKIELDDEEQALIRKYQMDGAVLVDVPQPGLVRNSFLIGLFCFTIATPIIAMNFWRSIGLGWPGVICVSAGIAILAGFIFYHQMRQTIYVRDLIHGRHFTCPSIIALTRQEAYLASITAYFRQVVESAKNWGGTETHKIEALPPDLARQRIMSGPVLA